MMIGSKLFRIACTLVSCILVVITAWIALRLNHIGAFLSPPSPWLKPYARSSTLRGPEDIAVNAETGIAYLSCGGVSTLPANTKDTGIHLLKLDDPELLIEFCETSGIDDFRPHGIDLYRHDGKTYLYAINHPKAGPSRIEKFWLKSSNLLVHEKSYSSPLLTAPNDLAVISENCFYISIDGTSRKKAVRALDMLLKRPSGSVILYNNGSFEVALQDLSFPNGLCLSEDKQYLYLAETLSGQVSQYHSNELKKLSYQRSIQIGTGLDNISMDAHGVIWVAQHTNLFQFSRYKENKQPRSPSAVHKIDSNLRSHQIAFHDDGSLISGTSIAIRHKNRLLIGSIKGPKMVSVAIP